MEVVTTDEWAVPRGAVDEQSFNAGRIGPYRLGTRVRKTAFGEVVLAIHEGLDVLLELDLLDALARTPLTAPDGAVLADLAHVAPLKHRHLAITLGSGFEEGVPYVVRPHRLGRTLSQLTDTADPIPAAAAAAILYAAAEATAFLAQQGPAPGVCSMGGFDDRDLFLGFDGAIQLVGLGLRRARGPSPDPIEEDVRACFALARRLDARSGAGLAGTIAGAIDQSELTRAVRRKHGAAVAERHRHVASAMRAAFADAVREERALYNLPPIH